MIPLTPVAALYDIHGNLPALRAVLADVAREGVETVVIGGDVAAGPLAPTTKDGETLKAKAARRSGQRRSLERDPFGGR